MEPRTPRTIWRLMAVPVERAADFIMTSARPSWWPPRGPVVPAMSEVRPPRMELATEARWLAGRGGWREGILGSAGCGGVVGRGRLPCPACTEGAAADLRLRGGWDPGLGRRPGGVGGRGRAVGEAAARFLMRS